jgi:uncharacterized protein YkwD
MKTASAWLLSILFLVSLAACGGGGGGGGGSDDGVVDSGTGTGDPGTATLPAVDPDVLAVLAMVNAERANAGLAPVDLHDGASEVALAHCEDMDVRDFFSHVNPDGQDPGDRLAEAGIACLGWGENIAMGHQSPEEVMTAWMNSDGHRANILQPAWTHIGIGVYSNDGSGPYWTQNFLALLP